jgi:hypothetical protein
MSAAFEAVAKVSRRVEQHIDALKRIFERRDVGHVALDDIDVQVCELFLGLRQGPGQCRDANAPFGQGAHKVISKQSGRTGYERICERRHMKRLG